MIKMCPQPPDIDNIGKSSFDEKLALVFGKKDKCEHWNPERSECMRMSEILHDNGVSGYHACMGHKGNTPYLLSGVTGVDAHSKVKLDRLVKAGMSRFFCQRDGFVRMVSF